MLPRGKLDIDWADLADALWSCLRPADADAARHRLEATWARLGSPTGASANGQVGGALACLSARTGFDLLLRALRLPAGSEVLVSAITIRDMPEIVRQHGLIPVPVDVDPVTLGVTCAALERARTPATRAILVAHLFGSRMPMDAIMAYARRHDLIVIEDCAQAYTGDGDRGHPESDACLFSFGPIKTSTALGGGIVQVRDAGLLGTMRAIEAGYPRQRRRAYARRVGRYLALKLLSTPALFSLFVVACRLARIDYDRFIKNAVRGFPGPDLIAKIRQRPSYPLIALLQRRLRDSGAARARSWVARRVAVAEEVIRLMPGVRRPGAEAAWHSHWVVPILDEEPDRLVSQLRRHGFDATRIASSLAVVEPPADRPWLGATEAHQLMRGVLYLPVYPGVPPPALARMAGVVARYATPHCVDFAAPQRPTVGQPTRPRA